MRTEKESNMKPNVRPGSPTKQGGQKNFNSEKNPPQPGEQDQNIDKRKYDLQGEAMKTSKDESRELSPNPYERNPRDKVASQGGDQEHHQEEQVKKPNEHTKTDHKLSDKSE
jgi:hypothetical protein